MDTGEIRQGNKDRSDIDGSASCDVVRDHMERMVDGEQIFKCLLRLFIRNTHSYL